MSFTETPKACACYVYSGNLLHISLTEKSVTTAASVIVASSSLTVSNAPYKAERNK
jgi:hypothetical protein